MRESLSWWLLLPLVFVDAISICFGKNKRTRRVTCFGAMQMIFELFGIDSTVSQSIHFSTGAEMYGSRFDTTVAKAQTHTHMNRAREAVGQWLSCRDLNRKIETSEKWFKSSRDYLLLHSSEAVTIGFPLFRFECCVTKYNYNRTHAIHT